MDMQTLTQNYFNARPNREVPHGNVAVLFLASSGAGKSTIRAKIVDELQATYVCNDEVRALLTAINQPFYFIKPIVDSVWQRLESESANHFVVFDSNLSSYYMHEDSYFHTVLNHGFKVYVIALDIPENELVRRIKGRDRADRDELLTQLPDQLVAQHKAMAELHPNFTITVDSEIDELIADLRAFVAKV
jgi:adenylate kinase family enzyme